MTRTSHRAARGRQDMPHAEAPSLPQRFSSPEDHGCRYSVRWAHTAGPCRGTQAVGLLRRSAIGSSAEDHPQVSTTRTPRHSSSRRATPGGTCMAIGGCNRRHTGQRPAGMHPRRQSSMSAAHVRDTVRMRRSSEAHQYDDTTSSDEIRLACGDPSMTPGLPHPLESPIYGDPRRATANSLSVLRRTVPAGLLISDRQRATAY